MIVLYIFGIIIGFFAGFSYNQFKYEKELNKLRKKNDKLKLEFELFQMDIENSMRDRGMI